MEVRIKKLDKELETPIYAAENDAAFDLRSKVNIEMQPGEKVIVPSGLAIEIPPGFVGNIRGRSGLAAKHSINTMAGIIDAGYRGEIGVVMINHSNEVFKIERNMRIAQMLIMPIVQAKLTVVDELTDTSRGEGGFGSTGHQ
tara:strand:+ start:61 stop:486 length:426 start_codon:yes stop_codon:yes gene_type:complete